MRSDPLVRVASLEVGARVLPKEGVVSVVGEGTEFRMHCIVCRKELKACGGKLTPDYPPSGAIVFYSRGNFGSTVFDREMDRSGEQLELYVCDECVKERAELVWYVEPVAVRADSRYERFDCFLKTDTLPDRLHMKPSEGPCDIHDWPTDGLAARFVSAMRERHGKGGVNACRDCIDRAYRDAGEKRHRALALGKV